MFACFEYKYDSSTGSTRFDVDYASSDTRNHEESVMTDETFSLAYFMVVVLLQVHYEKTMDIFWHSLSSFPSLFHFSPHDDETGDKNLNLGSAFTVCRCNLSPGYSPILPFVIRGTRTSRQRCRQRRSSAVRRTSEKKVISPPLSIFSKCAPRD